MIPGQLEVTAYHEAGHAVAYWWRGMTFRYVTVRSRYALGQVVTWGPRRVRPWDAAEIAAAGPVAEVHYLGRTVEDQRILDDLTAAVEFAELEPGEGGDYEAFGRAIPAEQWLSTWRGTETLITGTLWPAVEVVAKALIVSPRALRYAEVAGLADASLDV